MDPATSAGRASTLQRLQCIIISPKLLCCFPGNSNTTEPATYCLYRTKPQAAGTHQARDRGRRTDMCATVPTPLGKLTCSVMLSPLSLNPPPGLSSESR